MTDERPQHSVSKSALAIADLCGQKAWFELHARRPLVPSERVTFGSALDAAISLVITAARAAVPLDTRAPLAAAEEIASRDGVAIDLAEVGAAAAAFGTSVAPRFDFAQAGLQVWLEEDVAGLGPVVGRPDIRLADGAIYDLKSAAAAKPADAARTSVELGLYALLSEAATARPTPRVGYLTWVRTTRPRWQVVEAPVTDELRRRTIEVARAYRRAVAADVVLNRSAPTPLNFTFPSGPRHLGLCETCQYGPGAGGPCPIALRPGAVDGAEPGR